MRQIKFRGRVEDSNKIIFFELGEVELVADGLFVRKYDDYVVDIEQFIATDKDGYDVYEGDTLTFLYYIDGDGNAAPYKREVSRRAEIYHLLDIGKYSSLADFPKANLEIIEDKTYEQT